MPDAIASPPYKITIGGTDIQESDFQSFVIERDMFQPDMAAIVLSNQGALYSTKQVGDAVEIKVGDGGGTSIYKGEVVGLEPIYRGGEKSRILIRAMNQFHRLLRARKSQTFTDKTDQQILSTVVQDGGLTLDWKHEKSITYKHVYQHNLTAMEMVRQRAGRMGCHVWCVGTTLYVHQPDLQQSPIVKLKINKSSTDEDASTIRSFTPRLSSHQVLKKVTVKGWNPETKELITGEASAQSSKLGNEKAASAASKLAAEESFTVDHPIWSKEEADAIAKAKLTDMALTYVTGEVEVTGATTVDLGKVVGIEANSDSNKSSDPFNGNYYIMGITHRYQASKSSDGGFTTIMRLARDAQKGS